MQKGSKEWLEAKAAGKAAIDAGEFPPVGVRDGTVGHEEGPAGTWNTSGVELPVNTAMVRDVRPETSTAVSTEDLKEIGVPVRDASDYAPEATPAVEAEEAPKTDRTLEIPAAKEAVESSEKEDKKSSKKRR